MEPLAIYLLLGSLSYFIIQGYIVYKAAHDEKHYVLWSAFRSTPYVVIVSILALSAIVFWPLYLIFGLFVLTIKLLISSVKKVIK